MKKTLITSVAGLTIALSAGMSMTGPLHGQVQREHTKIIIHQSRKHSITLTGRLILASICRQRMISVKRLVH